VDVTDKASCPVAALFDLTPIGIEYAVVEIRVRRSGWLDLQHLIAPNAEVPVCKRTEFARAKPDGGPGCVKDNEVIPESMHFGEF
jgi:hypothetical protein